MAASILIYTARGPDTFTLYSASYQRLHARSAHGQSVSLSPL